MKNKYIFSFILTSTLLVVFISGCSQEPGTLSHAASGVTKFKSIQDFKGYLEKSGTDRIYMGNLAGTTGATADIGVRQEMVKSTAAPTEGGTSQPERVSKTNVQVKGIDEPDIVKTDGNQIYFSPGNRWSKRGAKIIDALPINNISISSEIRESGEMFLKENTLLIFSRNEIYGYDISNPKNPSEKWNIEINGTLEDARLYNGKVYIVTRNKIDQYNPCPVRPLTVGGKSISIGCGNIYHPTRPVPVDETYNAITLNPKTGTIGKTVSFVGSSGNSVVYMSKSGIYITYTYSEDPVDIFYGFFEENTDLIPSHVFNRIEKLKAYDISARAKMTELEVIMDNYRGSLGKDERMKFENEFNNRMDEYYDKHKRDFERTGVVEIDLNDMDVSNSGSVPGRPLNQFSLDEYEDNLRIATTVGRRDSSINDVYVLNEKLNITGSVKDLGETERIYSVRFIGDMGYVVTYRRVDPFYVLDLSDPNSPEMKGKLKIPGYSSYLHPIDEDTILGIGKEDNEVKISMFDVSNPENPEEVSKYEPEEYWSDISETHHAFLMDKKHEVFFLPGSKGGYVFLYKNNELELKKAISTSRVRRAIYINDYLYILGEEELIVLNENNWKKIGELEFEFEEDYPRPGPIPMKESEVG